MSVASLTVKVRPSSGEVCLVTSQLFRDAKGALEDAHAYPMFSPEYRAAVQHAYRLLKRVTVEVWNKEERDEARRFSDSLFEYLAVPWEHMDSVEVRYHDGTTEVLHPNRDEGAAEKMRIAEAMRVLDAWDDLPGA